MAGDINLSAVYLPNPDAKFTLLYFHGNAADLGNVYDLLRYMHANGFAVFSYDYPGYGTSDGSSSEQRFYQSGLAAYDYLVDTLQIDPATIVAYGQSLGTAVALDVALHRKVAALIMESPFITAFRTITQLPLFPLDRYKNNTKIGKLNVPVLIINGTRDAEIPPWQGRALYKLAPSPKQYYSVEGAGHNDIMFVAKNRFWEVLNQFLAKYVANHHQA